MSKKMTPRIQLRVDRYADTRLFNTLRWAGSVLTFRRTIAYRREARMIDRRAVVVVAYLVHDVWSQILGILARLFGDQTAVIVAVEQLEVPLLCLYRFQRCLGTAV